MVTRVSSDCGHGVQTNMGRGRTGLPVGTPKNASPCSRPPCCSSWPGLALPHSASPSLVCPLFPEGSQPLPTSVSLQCTPHRALGVGISICGGPALPRLPSSPGAPPPGSLGHCPVAGRPTLLLLHMLIGSWTNWPRVLLPLGLCTSCSIQNTHPHLSHLGLLSIKYPPVTALWGGY